MVVNKVAMGKVSLQPKCFGARERDRAREHLSIHEPDMYELPVTSSQFVNGFPEQNLAGR
jgi:hypothetical protein